MFFIIFIKIFKRPIISTLYNWVVINIKSVIMIAILDKNSEEVLNSKKNENSKIFLFNPIKFTHNALANPSIEIYFTIFLFFEKPKNIAKMAVIKTTISVCINYFFNGQI